MLAFLAATPAAAADDDDYLVASGSEVKLVISLRSLQHSVRVKYGSNSNDLCFSLWKIAPRNVRQAVSMKIGKVFSRALARRRRTYTH